MTPEQFTYWMQGFVEMTNSTPPTPEQWRMIAEHLKTVFNKVTPLDLKELARPLGWSQQRDVFSAQPLCSNKPF